MALTTSQNRLSSDDTFVVNALGAAKGGADDNDAQAGHLVLASTLTSGSHPGSNIPGRHKEDDVNLVVAPTLRSHPRPGSNTDGVLAFHPTAGGRKGLSETYDQAPGVGTGKGGTVAVANTLLGQSGRRQVEETLVPEARAGAVRRLMPVECERLMGWPDGWTAPDGVKAPDSRRYHACGDGVVANVAEWIGRRIVALDG
jgi:site-specific DNA-cytosine methylase